MQRELIRRAVFQLALEPDSPHVFLTCGEDGAAFQIDLRDPAPNKCVRTHAPRANILYIM